jgi:hypothetical protein
MDWTHLLAYITGTVDQELLLRNRVSTRPSVCTRAAMSQRLPVPPAPGCWRRMPNCLMICSSSPPEVCEAR